MRTSVLIDAGNLRSGGGLQVGASFIDEVAAFTATEAQRWPWLSQTLIEITPELEANLTRDVSHLNVAVTDRSSARRLLRSEGRKFCVSFTLFGPAYGRSRADISIVGFADSVSLWPEFIPRHGGARARIRWQARRWLSRRLFRGADRVVVEAEHVLKDLVRLWGLRPEVIDIIPNVVNSVFAAPLATPPSSGTPTFLYPTRLYAHKNLDVLGEAAHLLSARTGQRVSMTLTLNDDEWGKASPLTRKYSVNRGPQKIEDLPDLYREASGTIFPSLCECFSVTPLEAIAMGSPLLASRRPFVSDVVGDAAWYFEPTDPNSVAEALQSFLAEPRLRDQRVSDGLQRSAAWPSARDRAIRYLDLIGRTVDDSMGRAV